MRFEREALLENLHAEIPWERSSRQIKMTQRNAKGRTAFVSLDKLVEIQRNLSEECFLGRGAAEVYGFELRYLNDIADALIEWLFCRAGPLASISRNVDVGNKHWSRSVLSHDFQMCREEIELAAHRAVAYTVLEMRYLTSYLKAHKSGVVA